MKNEQKSKVGAVGGPKCKVGAAGCSEYIRGSNDGSKSIPQQNICRTARCSADCPAEQNFDLQNRICSRTPILVLDASQMRTGISLDLAGNAFKILRFLCVFLAVFQRLDLELFRAQLVEKLLTHQFRRSEICLPKTKLEDMCRTGVCKVIQLLLYDRS